MIQTQHLNTRLSFWQYLIAPLVSYFLLRLILMDLEITCRYQGAYIQHCSPYSPQTSQMIGVIYPFTLGRCVYKKPYQSVIR